MVEAASALHLCSAHVAIPSPLPAPKFANVIKQQGRFHLIMVMITHTNTARESNLINFNFRGLESVLMQLFITQRKEKWGLAAEVFNAGHKLKSRVVFQAPKAVISELTRLIPSQGHWERLPRCCLPTGCAEHSFNRGLCPLQGVGRVSALGMGLVPSTGMQLWEPRCHKSPCLLETLSCPAWWVWRTLRVAKPLPLAPQFHGHMLALENS